MKNTTILKATSIIMIVFICISLILLATMVIGIAALGNGDSNYTGILIATLIVSAIVGSALQLWSAIAGIKAANGTGKIKTAYVLGIINLVFALIGIILSMFSSSLQWADFISLLIAGAYFYGAYSLKKEIESASVMQ